METAGFSERADEIDVGYVAHLARLHLTAQEKTELQGQLEHILDYVNQLSELDVRDVPPTSHAVPVANVLRADVPRPCLDHADVMRNAPRQRDQQRDDQRHQQDHLWASPP